jgi:dihydroorotate dehydrogenase electron transfer subunit
MIQTQVTLTRKESIAPAWWRFTFDTLDLAPQLQPGQFLLIRCTDHFTCYLRRPIFLTPLNSHQLSLLLRPDPDPGLAWLATRQPGDALDVIGPLGTGFPLPAHGRNLLLVSDTYEISPLLGQMERALAAGMAVTLALGANRAAGLYPVAALPPVVELQAATLDGSLGRRGPVTELLPDLLRWADLVCALGSTELYRALRRQTEQLRFRVEPNYLYGLVMNGLLACGVGACLGCAITTERGSKLICLDGPVFDLAELTFA